MQQKKTEKFTWVVGDIVFEEEDGKKYNPYHDRHSGRFTTGGMAQGELLGMPDKTPNYTIQETLPGMDRPPGVPEEVQGIEQITAFMEDEHPGMQFDFTGSEEQTVREICDTLDKQLKMYPDVEKQMCFVGTEKGAPDDIHQDFMKNEGMDIDAYLGENAGAVTGTYERADHNNRTYMIFNTVFTQDKAHWEYIIHEGEQQGWTRELKPGVTAAQFTTKHEFGHAIWATIIERYGERGGPVPYRDGGFGTTSGIVGEWLNAHLHDAMNVSGYGYAGGAREAIAEGYSQITQAVHPSRFSGAVKKLFTVLMPNGVAKVFPDPTFIQMVDDSKTFNKGMRQLAALRKKLGIPEDQQPALTVTNYGEA